MLRNQRSFRRPASIRAARRRRGRHAPPGRPPATPLWNPDAELLAPVDDPAEVWGATAIELDVWFAPSGEGR